MLGDMDREDLDHIENNMQTCQGTLAAFARQTETPTFLTIRVPKIWLLVFKILQIIYIYRETHTETYTELICVR